MGNGIMEVVFILDRSGSMSGMEADTIGGFNSMLQKQKEESDKIVWSTVLFDHRHEVIHNRVPIQQVEPLTENQYYVRGTTALLDAVGRAIHHIAMCHKYAKPEDVPEKTLFIITTDGMENASRQYSYRKVKQMIELEQGTYGWEFLFLGANIDAPQSRTDGSSCSWAPTSTRRSSQAASASAKNGRQRTSMMSEEFVRTTRPSPRPCQRWRAWKPLKRQIWKKSGRISGSAAENTNHNSTNETKAGPEGSVFILQISCRLSHNYGIIMTRKREVIIMPQIIPIKELKNTVKVSELCHKQQEPIYVTKNGYGDMVLMSMDVFENMKRRLEMYQELFVSQQQFERGEVKDAYEALEGLRDKYDLQDIDIRQG